MLQSGRIVFSKMDEVIYGRPAAEAAAELVQRHGAERVFVMASGTLNRETDEIEKLRRALGNKCVGTFDKMPAHSPRAAVIAAANQARDFFLWHTIGNATTRITYNIVGSRPRSRAT